MNKTTQKYKEGIVGFDNLLYVSNIEKLLGSKIIKTIQNELFNITLAILQSEYDRLEGEKRDDNTGLVRESDLQDMDKLEKAYNEAITDQQSHILQTINEIKGL